MIKKTLVLLTGLGCDVRALEAASLIASQHVARIECLRVHPAAMQIIAKAAFRQFGTKMGNTELIHALQKEAAKRTADARASFDAFARANAGLNISWREVEGESVHTAIAEARYADLVVVGRSGAESEYSAEAVGSILVGCGRPVLLVPDSHPQAIGSTIAIAWKETAEAARAVTAAMPVLAKAERIAVISVSEDASGPAYEPAERLARDLVDHGLPAVANTVVPGGRPVADAVLQAARECGANLLVMGAYSHSRFRELVFGGFTRHVLHGCDLPVLLLH
jgi:nucleotide-binding universal stress UspA family protein